jgi:hypothetical protein
MQTYEDEALRLALSTLDEVRQETFRLLRNGQRLYAEDKVWSTIITIKEALAQTEQGEPVACERCKQLEEQAYDLLGKLKVANIKLSMRSQRTWAGLMRGVRVDGDTVVIKVKNGNDAARELCGALIEEMNK